MSWKGYTFYPAKEIVKGLWVGSEKDAADAAFMKKHDIRLIVNATSDIPAYSKTVRVIRVPIDDSASDSARLAKYLPITSVAIDDVLRYGKNVLVHCRAGMNRSASVVAGYLMFSRGMTAAQAMSFVKRRKSECFTPMNFGGALRTWETKLRANGRIHDAVKPQTPKPKTPKPQLKNKTTPTPWSSWSPFAGKFARV